MSRERVKSIYNRESEVFTFPTDRKRSIINEANRSTNEEIKWIYNRIIKT